MEPADFIFPNGPFRASQFPGEDLPGALAVWIGRAQQRVADLNAATGGSVPNDGPLAQAWVKFEGFDALCTAPATAQEQAVSSFTVQDKGSVSYRSASASSGPDYCALAREWYDRAGALATVYDAVQPATEALPLSSVVVTTAPQWGGRGGVDEYGARPRYGRRGYCC